MSGTEESILSTIPDFQDGGSSGGESSGTSTDSGPATTSAPPSGGDGGRTSAAPTDTDRTGSGTDSTQQPGAIRRRHDGLVEVPNTQNPATRDLVDPISGRVVAQGGIERRVYEEGQRHARENVQLRTQLQQSQTALRGISEVTQEAARLNVAPQDQVVAIRVMSDFMRDPVKTLQALVEEVKSKGYTIPFLEQGVTPGMDLAAIQRMIDQKMAPITQQHQQTRIEREQRAQAQQELDRFLTDNQEAEQNLDVLTEMLQAQPNLPLQSAWTKLIRWAHENGFDWTQSLRQQVAAQRQQQQPTNQQPEQHQQRPLPGPRSAAGGAPRSTNGAAPQFNENASWADIIRQSMQEHGVNLN